eukprot:1489357-Rhodomonas_salina.1
MIGTSDFQQDNFPVRIPGTRVPGYPGYPGYPGTVDGMGSGGCLQRFLFSPKWYKFAANNSPEECGDCHTRRSVHSFMCIPGYPRYGLAGFQQ